MSKTYAQVRQAFSTARDKEAGKPVMDNTYLLVSRESPTCGRRWNFPETVFALKYWHTEVIRWYPDGRVATSFNGWDTITTRRRIREYSPLHLGTYRGVIHAWHAGKLWAGTDSTWFWHTGPEGLCFEDGSPVPDVFPVPLARPIPKSRNTLTRPLAGDAFRDPKGKTWVCATAAGGGVLGLSPYEGDVEPDPRYFVQGVGTPKSLCSLELLVMAAPGWEAIPRFLWTQPLTVTPNRTQQENA